MLDQDYACCSMSVWPQQMVGIVTGPTQGRSVTMIVPPLLAQGDSDHESSMIERLKNNIRESLVGIPDNLPEIKGIRAKLPEAYEGKDDFNHLNSWLQGLIRFIKIYCLMGVDKDLDRVLVTGTCTCLKGKAECWFSHKVERPNRLICDWTFETMIVGLYRAFITTTMAQQAM